MELRLDTTAKVVSLTIGATTIVTSIVYLIIWLVQLNVGFVANTTLIKEIKLDQQEEKAIVQDIQQSVRLTATILNNIERRLVKVEQYTDHDDEEVQRVERKADINERDLKNHLDNHDWSFE